MNKFWPIVSILGLALLTANTLILLAILNRMPAPLVTFGEWRQKAPPADRQKLHDRLPLAQTITDIDNEDGQPVPVKIIDQPVEVRPVR